MGTSANITFTTRSPYRTYNFYRHYDGYPEAMIPALQDIFRYCNFSDTNPNKSSFNYVADTFYKIAQQCNAFNTMLNTVKYNERGTGQMYSMDARELCHYFEPSKNDWNTNYKYHISENENGSIIVDVSKCEYTYNDETDTETAEYNMISSDVLFDIQLERTA